MWAPVVFMLGMIAIGDGMVGVDRRNVGSNQKPRQRWNCRGAGSSTGRPPSDSGP